MRYVLYVAVAVAVVFFALTRTEVGRDGLRREVERQFARSFDGELQIRELRGNLLNRLSADDVVVRDARGELIATIDSVVLHPSWRDLFNRTISTGRIELISPEIHLHRLDDGRWNVQTLLYPDRALSAPRDAWSFRATRVQLRNGRVVSRNMGDAPDAVRDGFLFDYTNVDIRDVDGRAVVEWGDAMRLIDILELDGSVPALGLDFSQVRGQVVLREGQFALNEFYARVGNSRMHLNGSIVGLADLAQRPDATEIELELTESSFNASELARIAPFLPLRDSLIVELRVRGPLSELVVENASFARGRSVVELEGTLVGLPDSVDFEAAVRPSTMAWSDFAAVWPTSGVEPFDHLGLVRWRGLSAGVLHWASDDLPSRLVGTLNLEAASELGALSTEGVFEYENGHELQARGSLRADSLDLGQVIKRPDLAGALNGQLEYDVRGGNLTGASGRLRLSLSESVFAHRAIDTLDVVIEGQRSDLRGRGAAVTEIGSIYATAAASLESMPSYTLTGKTTRLNLGPLLKADTLTTELNSTFRIQGQGSTLASLNGSFEVSMDTSVVAYGSDRRSLPPHRTALTIHQHDSGESRIDIDGDVLQFTATGDAGLASLTNLAAHWNEAISASLEHEQAKTRSAAMAPTVTGESTSLESVSRAPGRSEAGGFVDIAPRQLDLYARFLRADILDAMLPGHHAFRSDAALNASVTMDYRSLVLDAELYADSLHFGGWTADQLNASVQFDIDSIERIIPTLRGSARVDAALVEAGDQAFTEASLDLEVQRRQLDIEASANARGADSPFELIADVEVLSDRQRLAIKHLQLPARDQTWRNPETSIVDFFADATIVHGLRLLRTGGEGSSPEQFSVSGAISASPSDTLALQADDILLEHVIGLFGITEPLGGTVNGRLALTGIGNQPELTGNLRIAPLSFEDRVLGAVDLSSRYIPGSPDVALRIDLTPVSASGEGRRMYENELRLEGTFRLPGTIQATGRRDPGSIDLDLAVTRADAFFFEYIFRNDITDVSGFLSGRGHIGGSFDSPLFDASHRLQEGRFRVPEFALNYSAEGPVTVDEEGIHLQNVRVSDPTEGTATVRGAILFNEYRYFSFDLHGALSDLRIMNVSQSRELPFYGTIWVSGDVSLTGPLSSASLRSENAVAHSKSDLYIPITESGEATDAGFIVFADSTGRLPDLAALTHRRGVLAERPAGERPFLDGLEIDLNLSAPQGSTVHLVIDPLLGDVINAVGSGRIQLIRSEGEYYTFGSFDVSSGDYLFTAGEVFFRRFLIDSGTITWDGDPLDAMLNIAASYRTRASPEGLGVDAVQEYIPLIIRMNVSGRVSTPTVDLGLSIDRGERTMLGGYESSIEAQLNQPEHVAEYATSVLLTNSFLLTTSAQSQLSDTRNQLAFNSLSQLVASQLNRYLNYALPNLDLNLGVQGESTQDLDVTYGVALRLLDERLVIRGEGIYQSDQLRREQQGVLDEFVVEVRLNPRVSVEMFYRREGDLLNVQSFNTSTTGAGVSYQTEFPSWRRLFHGIFGTPAPTDDEEETDPDEVAAGAEG